EIVVVVETSKATFEVECEHDGYLGALAVSLGDRVNAGELIAEVFDGPPAQFEPDSAPERDASDAVRLTKKAALLASELGVDLTTLPTGRFLTERDVAALAAADEPAELDPQIAARIAERSVVIFGAGGLGKSIVDLVRLDERHESLCVVDDDPDATQELLGIPLAGTRAVLPILRERGARLAANAVGAIGKIATRVAVCELLLEHGFVLPPLVDANAYVAPSARIGDGAQVFASAAVCADAELGLDTIVNTGAIVSHDCTIGAHTHIAPGATLAGHVDVGPRSLIGMGVTTAVGVTIGADAIVGNGVVVSSDVPDGTIVAAGTLWPRPSTSA
ncbi:MAG: biotin/lipoyl-containing protein, partial [Gaiellaceae bacterium]